ncbi:MAG: hypothetical protein SGILL_009779 [Bacillariaceae sp.]
MEDAGPSPSEERMLDAREIEKLLTQLERPGAKLQVETLVKKMRKEAAGLKALESTGDAPKQAPVAAAPNVPAPNPSKIPPPQAAPTATYTNIDKFAFDAGSSMDKFVTLYLPLPGVGSIPKDQIKCEFTKDGFDVTAMDLNGKNFRLKKNSLEHDIDPEKSKFIVKADKVVVKLAKIKGEYGSFDYWSKLTDPKKKDKKSNKSNPAASINEMMKEMYDNGDDQMRKMIGETMLKQRTGELNNENPMGGMGGGLGGGMDDF